MRSGYVQSPPGHAEKLLTVSSCGFPNQHLVAPADLMLHLGKPIRVSLCATPHVSAVSRADCVGLLLCSRPASESHRESRSDKLTSLQSGQSINIAVLSLRLLASLRCTSYTTNEK